LKVVDGGSEPHSEEAGIRKAEVRIRNYEGGIRNFNLHNSLFILLP